MALATFGDGCFWCVEAVFLRLTGVNAVRPGYSNGQMKDPTYKDVCTGGTGHAEVIQIDFDEAIILFEVLVEVMLHVHDPTTLNRQGADIGTQYRSGIYYHNESQKEDAQRVLTQIDESSLWQNPIVTEIVAAEEFYPAEDYHHNYFAKNPGNPYCIASVGPKLAKLTNKFPHLLVE